MFKILEKTFRTGIVTTAYPKSAPKLPAASRGAPQFDLARWQDARPAAEAGATCRWGRRRSRFASTPRAGAMP